MVVTSDSLRTESFFSYNSESELKLDSDEAYADAFMELLESAVRCRTRNVTDVGVTLSGGLDSTTIASVAASQSKGQSFSVHTFSAIFDTVSTCDERRFIEPVLERMNVSSTLVPGDRQHPIGYLDRMLKFQDEPFSAPNAAMMWDVYAAIQQAGLHVVLSGHGGDETVSHGSGYLKELAIQRSWLRLATELHAASPVLEHSFLKTFLTYVRFGLRPNSTESSFVDFLRSVWRSGAIFRPHTHSDSSEGEKQRVTDILSPTFLKRFDYRARMEFWRESRPGLAKSERERHYRVLTEPIQPLCFEVLDKMGYAHSFELRYPLWDQRIVEFCLALPANQKMNGGRGRIVMRRAMEGRLPKTVQWRLDKTDFTENLKQGLLENDAEILPRALHSLDLVGEYVDIEKVGMIPNKMLSGGATSLEMSVLLITTTLNKWLQKESA
ncbi:MAG: asparagine synthase [Bacteroidetes bacterium]|nr:asparagine synthase [Bacteroidota bacterium]